MIALISFLKPNVAVADYRMKAKDFTVVKRPTLPKIQSAQPMIIGS
jgi:hypothetical protein